MWAWTIAVSSPVAVLGSVLGDPDLGVDIARRFGVDAATGISAPA